MSFLRKHVEWLEEEPLRIRKYLAIVTTYTWIITIVISIIAKLCGIDLIVILSIVTGQFAVVVGFYFVSKASTDSLVVEKPTKIVHDEEEIVKP